MFELKFPKNHSFPGIADLWAVKALVWTTKPTGSPTPESRKSIQPKRVPAACLFYTEMCIFRHICPPISRKPEFSRHSGACGLRVPSFYCKTHQVASSRKSALGDDRPANYPTPYRHMLQCPMFELKFPRNQSFPGIADLWAVKALVWTTKPTGSPTPDSRKSTQPKRVPAVCLFYTEMCIFGHICPPISRKLTGSPTPESRKSTQPKRVPAACLFYTEMCIFRHICPPISRKPEFSRHSGACGLRVPSFYCKTHQVASSRKSALGDDRPANYPTPYRHMLQCPMFELKFPRNQSFPGIADLWAVKALVWTTKPTGSPTPESRKSIQPKRVPAACLFYTEMCIFRHICPPISRKPQFSRHSGACGLRVPPFYCKTHQVASSRKSALGDDRPANYPTPYRHMLQCPMFELKFPRNQSFPGIADLWAVKALVWTTKSTVSPNPESRKSTHCSRRGYPRYAFSIRKCAFSVIFVPLFLGNQSFPGIAVRVV